MTTINKRLLIARTEHFSIISINTAERLDEQYEKHAMLSNEDEG